MAGFENDVGVMKNLNFDLAAAKPHLGILNAQGKLPIGTGNSSPTPEVLGGNITSTTLTVGYSSPDITIETMGGGQPIEQITVDNSTVPGTNPVLPTAGGNITITGGQVPNANLANVIQTHSFAANSFAVTIQRSDAVAATDSSQNGVCHFDSADFTVDANGFVSLVPADLHITPFIVSPSGISVGANYTTIQSALNAADAAGGGMIWVQPGTYTENLTLYTDTQIIGAVGFSDFGGGVVIVGVHTPPATGNFLFRNVRLESATHIFSSNAAGSSSLVIADSAIAVTSGYTFNLPNWTGAFQLWDVYSGDGTHDGFVNNTAGAVVVGYEAGVGVGTTQTMTVSGPVIMEGCQIDAPSNFVTGASCTFDECQFTKPLTFSNNSTGSLNTCRVSSGASAAITMSSSASVNINTTILTSSNNPAIAGAGAGTLTLANVTFTDNTAIASTVVLASEGTFVRTPIYRDESINATVKINSGSFATDAITLTTPVSTNLSDGDLIEFVATNGVLIIQFAATQIAHIGTIVTSAAGSFTSTATGDSVSFRYQASTNDWWATSVIGTWVAA